MAYETTLTITLNVDGGPPAMKESSKIDGVAGVFSKRVSFCSKLRDGEEKCICTDDRGNQRVLRVKKLELGALEPLVETLSFISLKASRYVYKRCNVKN